MPRPRRSPVTMGLAMVIVVLQSGCSGTPFGEGLSRSFPSLGSPDSPATPPGASVPSPEVSAKGPVTGAPSAAPVPSTTGTPSSASGPSVKPLKPASTPGSAAGSAAAGSPAAPTPIARGDSPARVVPPAARPLPYRITIRLPEADPSAPAEAVTRALRATGVAFEVETIERIASPGSATGAPPAPGSAATPETTPAAPTIRPAPPPR